MRVAAGGTRAFTVQLPLLPLSSSGTLLSIRWIVRAETGEGGNICRESTMAWRQGPG